MRTGNPALQAFQRPQTWADLDAAAAKARSMTLGGTVIACAVLFALCALSALFTWGYVTGGASQGTGIMIGLGGALGGLVLALVISFAPRTAPFLSPLYALAEGAFLAVLSYIITTRFMKQADTGLIFQAVGVTFAIAGGMLGAYAVGLVRIGGTGAKVMLVALSGLCVYALAIIVCNGLLGLNIPNLYSNASPIGIGFTALCVVLASLFLVLDFQHIEQGIKTGAPRYMEWYGAFGLLVTLVWLYIEVLRLLAKLKSE